MVGRNLGRLSVIAWLTSLNFFLISTLALPVEDSSAARSWKFGMEAGYGHLVFSSDQRDDPGQAAFAFHLLGGRELTRNIGVGLELGGWTLESENLRDPMVGRGVWTCTPFVEILPSPQVPIFVRLGGGWAGYSSHRPLDFGSNGWSWSAGLGYRFRMGNRFAVAPRFRYSSGRLGDVQNPIFTETGRRFLAWDVSVGLAMSLGNGGAKPR